MKGVAGLIIILLGVILVSGCTQVKDCGSDKECFLEAAQTCSPAKLTTLITIGDGSYNILGEVESHIRGFQGNGCVFYLELRDIALPEIMPSDLAEEFNVLKGSEMVCTVPRDVKIETFDELKGQILDVYNEGCAGTYKTLSEQVYQKMFDYWERPAYTNITILGGFCAGGNVANVIIKNTGTAKIALADVMVMDASSNTPIKNPAWTNLEGTQSIAELAPGKTGRFSTACIGYCIYRFAYAGSVSGMQTIPVECEYKKCTDGDCYNLTPTISFVHPTPDDGDTILGDSVYVNVSTHDENEHSVFIDFDGSLVSWWRMDDLNSTGDPTDYMNRNNGSKKGNAAQVTNGYLGKGFGFNGNGDYVDCGAFDVIEGVPEISVSFWVKYKNTDSVRYYIVDKEGSGSNDVFCFDFYTNSFLRFYVWNSTTVSPPANTNNLTIINDLKWHHFVGVYNGTHVVLYTDGIGGTPAKHTGNTNTATATLTIGCAYTGSGCFNGTIDDVMIFNRSLSAEEVSALYANQTPRYLTHGFTSLSDGSHTFKAYAQDLEGNVGKTEERTVTIGVDTPPDINFINPTPPDGSTQTDNDIFVNVFATDSQDSVSTFIDFDDSLVSWWRFDDNNGTHIFDYTGRNNGAIINGTIVNNGMIGKGMHFDGDLDYISIDDNTVFNYYNKTISFWMNHIYSGTASKFIMTTMGVDYITTRYTGGNNRLGIVWRNGDNTKVEWYKDGTVIVGDWALYTITFNVTGDNVRVNFYRNGAYLGGNTRTDGMTLGYTSNGVIGIWYTGNPRSFWGYLDDIMYFNRTLSAEEIRALYADSSEKYLSHSFTDLDPGDHTFKAYAQDLEGNVGKTEERRVTIGVDIPPLAFDDSLVSWWSMDDVDSSGNPMDYFGINNGIAQGNAHQVNSGYLGKGFGFDGDGDYVDFGNDASLNFGSGDFSVSLWAKASNSGEIILLKGRCGSGGHRYMIATNKYEIDDNTNDHKISYSILDNNWHHIVAVKDSDYSRVYIDSVEDDDSPDYIPGYGSIDSQSDPLTLGIDISGTGCGSDFTGTIDEVMIFNRTLSEEEINELYVHGSLKEGNANLTIWDSTDSQTKYINETIRFYANFTNSTSGEPVNGAGVYCDISFNTAPSGPFKMTFNPSSRIYEYSRSLNQPGLFEWDVMCGGSSQGYGALVVRDYLNVNPIESGLPIVPGIQGWGIYTPAGSGRHLTPASTTVYKVTNLNPSGTGSLYECLTASGPRVCVFEVSGQIPLTRGVEIKNPYLTVAGQTAPSPGITIETNGAFKVRTHDVLIQHLRFRTNNDPPSTPTTSMDTFRIQYPKDNPSNEGPDSTYNVVVDHCTFSWGQDETVSFWDGPDYITVSNSIIAEGMFDSMHPKGQHARGMMTAINEYVFIYGNLFIHNNRRNPKVGGYGFSSGIIANNIIYNYGKYGAQITGIDGTTYQAFVKNVGIAGFNTRKPPTFPEIARMLYIQDYIDENSKIYVEDNDCPHYVNDAWDCISNTMGDSVKATHPYVWIKGLTLLDANQVKSYVLNNAGARPSDRDSKDKQYISDVNDLTGQFVDCIDAAPLYYDYGTAQAGTSNTITLGSSASSVDDRYGGKTVIESGTSPMENKDIEIIAGTGAGQVREVIDYVGSTRIAAVSPNWDVIPDATSKYAIVNDCDENAGGWPVLEENYRSLTLPSNPNGDDDKDGYTNLEEWLHSFSAQVEGGA